MLSGNMLNLLIGRGPARVMNTSSGMLLGVELRTVDDRAYGIADGVKEGTPVEFGQDKTSQSEPKGQNKAHDGDSPIMAEGSNMLTVDRGKTSPDADYVWKPGSGEATKVVGRTTHRATQWTKAVILIERDVP
jgi:hypothetical protein